MKFKLKDLLRIKSSIKKLVGQSVKVSVMFRLRHFVNDVDKEMRALDECRNDLIKRLGVKEGANYTIPQNDFSKQEQFENEFKELIEQEVEIRTPKVKISDFEIAKEGSEVIETPAGEGIRKVPPLNILDIANLSFLFEDEDEIKEEIKK
jgi:hypothetical protein